MAIERWEPFRGAMSLRDVMDWMFRESVLRPDWFPAGRATRNPSAFLVLTPCHCSPCPAPRQCPAPPAEPSDDDLRNGPLT